MKKLRNQRGETLIETLCALLIATLALAFLATGITSSANMNAAVRDKASKNVVTYSKRTPQEESLKVVITIDGAKTNFLAEEYVYENDYRSYSYSSEANP